MHGLLIGFFFSFIELLPYFFFALVTKNKQTVSILVFLILSRTACQKTGALMGALLQTTDGGYIFG